MHPVAVEGLKHPCKMIFCGKAKTGKTTLALRLVYSYLRPRYQYDRVVVFCPTVYKQEAYKGLVEIVDEDDLHTTLSEVALRRLLEEQDEDEQVKTLLIIDDFADNPVMHSSRNGGRQGAFANIGNSSRHFNLSVIVVTQNATSISPAYRDNVDVAFMFRATKENEIKQYAMEWNPCADKKLFMSFYRDATRSEHSYLTYINLEQPHLLRLMSQQYKIKW